jgi:hypothetical protein
MLRTRSRAFLPWPVWNRAGRALWATAMAARRRSGDGSVFGFPLSSLVPVRQRSVHPNSGVDSATETDSSSPRAFHPLPPHSHQQSSAGCFIRGSPWELLPPLLEGVSLGHVCKCRCVTLSGHAPSQFALHPSIVCVASSDSNSNRLTHFAFLERANREEGIAASHCNFALDLRANITESK